MTSQPNRPLPLAFPTPVTHILDQIGAQATTGVIVVCGFPAAGKTTASKYLAGLLDAMILDKDTFAPRLEESVMATLSGNPYDRDSEIYRRVVSPFIYEALVCHAVSIGNRCPVIVDGPFLSYIRTASDQHISLSNHIRRITDKPSAHITTLWLDAEPDRIRDRMIRRAAARDLPKLAEWETYRADVLESGLPESARIAVDYFVAT